MSALACGLLAVSAQAAAPSIEGVSASQIASKQATLEATVNPQGLETKYELWIAYAVCQKVPPGRAECESFSVERRAEGQIAAGSSGQAVSTTLTNLSPGYLYTYWAVASNTAGKDQSADQTFTTSSGPPAPSIEGVSLSNLTPTDATLEAQIDTEGLETTYQFEMWASPCGPKCELLEDVSLPSGKLLGSFGVQSVSLDLNSVGVTLTPGGEYGYSVSATSAAGSTEATWQTFTAPGDVIVPLKSTTSIGGGAGSAGSGSQTSGPPASQPTTFYALPWHPVTVGKTAGKGHSEGKRPVKHKKRKRHKSKAAVHGRHKARKR